MFPRHPRSWLPAKCSPPIPGLLEDRLSQPLKSVRIRNRAVTRWRSHHTAGRSPKSEPTRKDVSRSLGSDHTRTSFSPHTRPSDAAAPPWSQARHQLSFAWKPPSRFEDASFPSFNRFLACRFARSRTLHSLPSRSTRLTILGVTPSQIVMDASCWRYHPADQASCASGRAKRASSDYRCLSPRRCRW